MLPLFSPATSALQRKVPGVLGSLLRKPLECTVVLFSLLLSTHSGLLPSRTSGVPRGMLCGLSFLNFGRASGEVGWV